VRDPAAPRYGYRLRVKSRAHKCNPIAIGTRHVSAALALATTTLVIVVIVAPACLAMPIVIDSVAVLESIRPMTVGPMIAGTTATRYAHEGSKRTQYSCPIKCIHWLILLEFGASSYETRPSGRRDAGHLLHRRRSSAAATRARPPT
jgi:hypothetical protein